MKTIFLIILFSVATLRADYGTRVGNGDDGSDLESLKPVHSGVLIETRKMAIEKLRKLRIESIPSLGMLLPEVEKTTIFLASNKVNEKLKGEDSRFHTDEEGSVFARTFAEPHAPTRFYPASLTRTQEELIALHIHEGLHRALPISIRENEAIVSDITLAIVSPEATFDRVSATVKKYSEEPVPVTTSNESFFVSNSSEHFQNASSIGISAQQFFREELNSFSNTQRTYIVESQLYPFGYKNVPFGLGLKFAVIENPQKMVLGPLGIFPRLRLWSVRDFEVGAWAHYSVSTLSSEEYAKSGIARDAVTLGILMKKTMANGFVQSSLGYTFEGKTQETIGKSNYEYAYGPIWTAKLKGGVSLSRLFIASFLELNVGNSFTITSPAFNLNIDRYHLFSVGPEIGWLQDSFEISAFAKALLSSSENINLDYLGNFLEEGSGKGSLGVKVSLFF